LNCQHDDNALFENGPAHGAPPQNVRLGDGDYLLDHLGGGFDLLYFTQAAALPASLQSVLTNVRAKGVRIRVTAVGAGHAVAGCDQTLPDTAGDLRQRYGMTAEGAAYLLRPDQHICARWLSLEAPALQAALANALPQ
jgi:3-(3-hydroxy-phenyl)propionate hydroxylase